MSSKCLKSTAVFLAVVAVILGVFISCENPFATNLGEKVDVENPKIWGIDPKSGTYIKDTAFFNGQVSAYRELRSNNPVEVAIARPDSTQPDGWGKYAPWSSVGIKLNYDDKRRAEWSYNLDTTEEQDGFLKVKFRVRDPRLVTETVELIYIVKNGPSVIKMIMPPEDPNKSLSEMPNDSEIRGQIVDRRGVKPGYPRIKIWKKDTPEPDETGWAIMFLSNIDITNDNDGWAYTDRTQRKVDNVVNFAFKLADYTMDSEGRVTYTRESDGKYKSFVPGEYNYRILVSDTYFYDDAAKYPDKELYYPRDPVKENGEREIVTFHPTPYDRYTNPLREGNFNSVKLNPPGERPVIELVPDPSPEATAKRKEKPNIYMTEDEQSRKILTGDSSRDVFELRVRAYHPLFIARATLEWEHSASGRSGVLVDDESDWSIPPLILTDGSFFTFRAKENLEDKVTHIPIFESPDHSAQPYTLKVTAISTSNEIAERTFTVYVSKDLPTVEVQSVKGAATEPQAAPDDFYTVNQNIEVTVNYAASGIGMNQENDRDVVKWFVVKEDDAAAFEAKITAYQENPTDPDPNKLKFFNEAAYTADVSKLREAKSGWVENRALRFNTTNFADGSDLRLFIVVQDKVQNLGYTSIKLKVDQASDKPEAKSPTLTARGEGGINSLNDLFIILNDNESQNTPGQTRKNILDKDTGVYLTLNDDDGINRGGGVTITLTDRNTAGTPAARQIDVSKIQFSGSSKEWSGELTQAVMAAAINNNGSFPYLKDGIYELTITCSDDSAAKVSIGENDPQAAAASVGPLTFYFCVISNQPAITVTSPGRNAFVTTDPTGITGTITSRVPMQRLWIGFSPALITPPSLNPNGGVSLYLNSNYTNEVQLTPGNNNTGAPNSNGEYMYYWRVQNVLFASVSPSEERAFTLRAADNLGNVSQEQWEVKMDNTPPKVDLEDFYFSRPLEIGKNEHQVNGKFNFKISGWDNDAIAQDPETGEVAIKWWILPAASAEPTWSTAFPSAPAAGTGGQFVVGDKDNSTGYYGKIINSATALADKTTYKLYAIAKDRAGNVSTTVTVGNPTPKKLLQTFYVDQESDYPKLGDLEPADKRILSSEGGLYIKATVSDDDDFRSSTGIPNPVGHVSIRWTTSASGTFTGSWTTIPAGAVTFDSNGALNLNYTVPNTVTNTEGWKYYQIRVIDVVANKNPDGATGTGSLPAVTKIFPSETTTYSFFLKNNPPVINFTGASGRVFGTRAALLAALGGNVTDTYLASVTVSLDRDTPVPLMSDGIPVPNQGAHTSTSFTWDLGAANLNWLPANFSTIAEGMHIVTITAQDVAGNTVSTDWLFYKDTTGPVISFSNIKEFKDSTLATLALTEAVIAHTSDALYLTGRFEDLSSPIQTTTGGGLIRPTYRFNGATSGANTGNVTIIDGAGTNAVTWRIPLAGLPDGKNSVTIQVSDDKGNITAFGAPWYFVKDSKIPEVTNTDDMTVRGSLGDNFTSGPITDENSRVFSAAGVNATNMTTIFTLEGYAEDVNLNFISVSLRRGSTANDPPLTSAPASPANMPLTFTVSLPAVWIETAANYSQQSAEADSQKRLTVTKEAESNRWKWSLNVLSKDLATLQNGLPPGDPCFVSVNARDAAQFNSEPRHWRFYLDTTAPKPEFSFRTSGEVFDSQDVSLKGTVDDDKRVKNIRYSLSKYNYTDSKWYYCSGGNWNILAAADVLTGGLSIPGNTVWSNYTMPANPGSLVSWTLDNAELRNATVSGTNTIVYGNNILGTNGQGWYKLFIEATDYSLAAGSAAGNLTVKSVEFHVDREEPKVDWTGVNSDRTSFRNKDGVINLNLTASDINYIDVSSIKVDIKDSAGNSFYSKTNTSSTPDITVDPPTFAGGIYTFAITLKPNKNGSDWPDGRYTLTLKVKDDAGREASVNRDFTVDNTAPDIDIDGYKAGAGAAPPSTLIPLAITGRNEIKGKFTATGSPLAFMAYKVVQAGDNTTPSGLPTDPKADIDLTDAGKTTLATAGWRFGDGTNNNLKDPSNSNVNLVTIGTGVTNTNVTILIPDAVNLRAANFAAQNSQAASGIFFPAGTSITGKNVNRLVIYFLVVDEAGNWKSAQYIYWIYPEGDRPTVTVSRPDQNEPEEKRLLNGRIRIGGTAKDNVRVKHVWFRILDENGDPITNRVTIPEWDALWNSTATTQTPDNVYTRDSNNNRVRVTSPNTGTYGTGWFMANGGGKAEVPWYAYINNNSELDPLNEGSRKITIEVLAEDTMRNEAGEWFASTAPPHMYSSDTSANTKKVSARVVKDAPEFSGERIKRSASGANTTNVGVIGITDFTSTAGWVPVEDANIRERASYSVTVTHDAGIKEIQWIRDGLNPVNLLNVNDSYNVTDYAAAISGNLVASEPAGIAVKAGPKSPLTGTSILATGKKYLVWKWDRGGAGYTSLFPPEIPTGSDMPDMRFMIVTGNGSATVGTNNILLPENDNGKFEWVVVVDIHADYIDGGKYKYIPGGTGDYSGRSKLKLKAFENSQSVPLDIEYESELPIDNQPPKAAYTHNTKVAGPGSTFGGEAGDSGAVNGLARVVLWFSQAPAGGGAEVPISWDYENHPTAFRGGGTIPPGVNDPSWLGTGTTSSNMPDWEYYKGSTSETNFSCIVMEKNDPLGESVMYGHKRPIGFATIGAGSSGLDKGWYVTLDSTNMISGRVTAHYIVFDKAGNATYYKQKLIIMNGVPRISGITLATDIRGDNSLTGAGGSFTANGSYGQGRDITPSDDIAASPLDTIRSKFTTSWTDIQKGVSNVITVDTDTVKDFGVVYDEPFNVRNNLLAVKVEVPQEQGKGGKTRTFRVEYVSGGSRLIDSSNANNVTGTAANPVYHNGNGFYRNIKAGRIYIVENPGSGFPWKTLGAQLSSLDNETIRRGAAFMAVENGNEVNIPIGDYRAAGNVLPSIWELNNYYYTGDLDRTRVPTDLVLSDVHYPSSSHATQGKSAEFVYAANAFDAGQFGTNTDQGNVTSTKIHDFNPAYKADGTPEAYPYSNTRPPWEVHSLFIVKVFGGDESELFGDFALLSIRVNNNDRTRPYAQLYDLNPKTEGQDSTLAGANAAGRQLAALQPAVGGRTMGANYTKGGLWNTGTVQKVAKSGHIEPRRTTSLTSAQMGGAATKLAASITKPYLAEDEKTAKLFNVDTVSGDVILRGYVEDDQRIRDVDLDIGGTTVRILETKPNPKDPNGFGLQVTTAETGRVAFNETIDLYRHRVEWAYLWRTEQVPGGNNVVASNINVRAIAYNATESYARKDDSAQRTRDNAAQAANRVIYDDFNPDYPRYSAETPNLLRYNQIPVNLRPYITGFRRNQSAFAHNTRSRQGWYMFARGEQVVVAGFNLANGTGNTNITVGGAAVNNIGNAAGQANSHAIAGDDFTRTTRFRTFTVPAAAAGDAAAARNSVIRLTVNNINAVNTFDGTASTTRDERRIAAGPPVRPINILPWNIEYSPGIDGSELWDDFTQAHIWQSDDTAPAANTDAGRFASEANWVMLSPSMSIDPRDGTLWASYNQGGRNGTANNGNTFISGNGTTTRVASFIDPILFSDIYYSTGDGTTSATAGASAWSAYSIIGRAGTYHYWRNLGGLYMSGPNGVNPNLDQGAGQANQYLAEGTYYNASQFAPGDVYSPPTTDQFMNPHIITSRSNNYEHIHVSYYDTKDGSIKYRYNRRGAAGDMDPGNNTQGAPASYGWTNLDGGFDADDLVALTAVAPFTAVAANRRVVNYAARSAIALDDRPNVGKHNAIAVTSEGYPVVIYYDETNQKIKMAVSNSTTPFAAADGTGPINWKIIENIIPTGNMNAKETGQFVSMRIDTRNNNRIHIAALNMTNKNLVYISGFANYNTGTFTGTRGGTNDPVVQVVDSVGNVGRWCAVSLDNNGNPWIAYMDEGYLGSRDGAKVAYLNTDTFYKGANNSDFPGEYIDFYGVSLAGWETMHVPTLHRVENPVEGPGREHGRLGLECYPTRNYTGSAAAKIWSAAIGYLSQDAEGTGQAMDRYRVAYYVK
jgi:hypothetical protein